jgi:hypothetical protein
MEKPLTYPTDLSRKVRVERVRAKTNWLGHLTEYVLRLLIHEASAKIHFLTFLLITAGIGLLIHYLDLALDCLHILPILILGQDQLLPCEMSEVLFGHAWVVSAKVPSHQ